MLRKHYHHLDACNFKDVTTGQSLRLVCGQSNGVDPDCVPPLHMQNPAALAIVWAIEDTGMAARNHLARSQVNVDKLFVVVGIDGLRGFRGPADVDGSPLHIKGPTESHDLCEGVDTVLSSKAGVGVVLSCLDRLILGSEQVLAYLVDYNAERVGIMS